MDSQQRDAYKEITFKFDDDVVVHRRKKSTTATATEEEDFFRLNCRDMNTSTPKKHDPSDVKMAIIEARSSFFGLDDLPPKNKLTESQMDTADLLANCTVDDSATTNVQDRSSGSCSTCDINNNNLHHHRHEHINTSKTKSESGLGSISDEPSDEPDSKVNNIMAEKELLLDNHEEFCNAVDKSSAGDVPLHSRNIIREPQYYPPNDHPHNNNTTNPSQAVYLATTVPQNIKGNKIMGRHTPTRTSLRHSRMLVISKDLRGALNPLNIFHPRWATFFLILHILMGLLVTAIGLWFLLWAPHTRIQDNPYWSGLVLILCGSMGIVVMEFKRIPRNATRERCFNMLRINLLVVLFLTLITTLIAFACAAIHSLSLFAMNTVCIPANLFTKSSSCVCIFDKPVVDMSELEVDQSLVKRNDSVLMDTNRIFLNVDDENQFHYRDLNCNEVTGAFKLILLGSSLANLLGFIATIGFLLLYYHGTRQVNLYATVRQPATGPTLIT